MSIIRWDYENYWCDITKKSGNGSWLFDQEIRGLSNEPPDSFFGNDSEWHCLLVTKLGQ